MRTFFEARILECSVVMTSLVTEALLVIAEQMLESRVLHARFSRRGSEGDYIYACHHGCTASEREVVCKLARKNYTSGGLPPTGLLR
jgi:hypothetical protein